MIFPDNQPPPGESPDEGLEMPEELDKLEKLLPSAPKDAIEEVAGKMTKALHGMKSAVTPPEVIALETHRAPKAVLDTLYGTDDAAAQSLISDLRRTGMIPPDWPEARLIVAEDRIMRGADCATAVLLTSIRASELKDGIEFLPKEYAEVQDDIWILKEGSVLIWSAGRCALQLLYGKEAARYAGLHKALQDPLVNFYAPSDMFDGNVESQMGALASFLYDRDEASNGFLNGVDETQAICLAARAARIYRNTLLLASPPYMVADCVLICTAKNEADQLDLHINARVIGTPRELQDRELLIDVICTELDVNQNKGSVTLLTSANPAFGPCIDFPAWTEMSVCDYYLTPTAAVRASQWDELENRIEDGFIAGALDNPPEEDE